MAFYCLNHLVAPPSEDYIEDANAAFSRLSFSKPYYLMNSEYMVGNIEAVTLYYEENDTKHDIGKALIADGYALAEKRREARLQSTVNTRVNFNIYKFSILSFS